ncbi:urea ABC transporter permease subunit UrtB [Maridesulfovibrio bastinii]|uniref:urea ABC transporter permease subunit UrtB n=1 Tax=Maridesulfovibrio bastinii TaxID=47157 RepID=UPI000408681B|nr:urea ABC transporter permease subunit UrtB [Maridesulfovibrio bastinii]
MKNVLTVFIVLLTLLFSISAQAAENSGLEDAVASLATHNRRHMVSVIKNIGELGDVKALPVLQALMHRDLRFDGNKAVIVYDDKDPVYAMTGEPFTGDKSSLKNYRINNMVRRAIKPVIAELQLYSSNREERLAAANELAEKANLQAVNTIEKVLSTEKDKEVAEALKLALALTSLKSNEKGRELKAIQIIGDSGNPLLINRLNKFIEKDDQGKYVVQDAEIVKAAHQAISTLKRKQIFVRAARDLFYGISLGSVLLLAALGLAITFGLMGVINMAHGEMLMLGAYSTYAVQELFVKFMPSMTEWYLILAIPLSFAIPCAVGMLLERGIIRYLYGRPLETLLATWGISLALIQTVRLIFGAQNVEVRNPDWLTGGFQLTDGLMITYNHVAIIVFVIFVVALVWFLLNKTPLGLQVRAVTQRRSTASAMGIYSSRIDMWTFGLGSGIAGLGGLALTLVGNVGPELGQSYIVDSFMVVVLGGVGKIAGTVVGSMSLGVINKILEPFTGAVLGKIIVLALVIIFIQKRPQGIFALKGRMAED